MAKHNILWVQKTDKNSAKNRKKFRKKAFKTVDNPKSL